MIDKTREIEQYVYEAGCDDVGTFRGKFEGGIQAQQIPDEIAPCINAILESGEMTKHYLEIGVAAGGTTRIMHHFLKFDQIVLIDDNQHPKAHIRPYILDGIKHIEIIGTSLAQGTIDKLKSLNLMFDVIFIDADHSYLGISRDVKLYREFLRPGGFLILHDTLLPEWGPIYATAELKKDKEMKFLGEYATKKPMKQLGVTLFQRTEDRKKSVDEWRI